ncbi:hypothetical protein RB595_006366 [Gaeumannomyces hyphopodioides]
MGRVRTKTVKKSAKVIIERYYPKLTLDFETNKRICDEIAIIASKRLRNKIAGYTTHLMKRIQRGPVRGISFKLQEEERERKDQYVPEVSALDFTQNTESGQLDVDVETKDLLKHLGVCAHRPPPPAALRELGCRIVSAVGRTYLLTIVLFSSQPVRLDHPRQRRPRYPDPGHRARPTPLRRQAPSPRLSRRCYEQNFGGLHLIIYNGTTRNGKWYLGIGLLFGVFMGR